MKGSKRAWNDELIVAEVTLRKFEIPEYLKKGELYRTLIENNNDPNEELTFLSDVLKSSIQVDSMADCDHLLNSLRFWGVDGVGSTEIISYVLTCAEPHDRIVMCLQKYEKEFKFVLWLRKVMLARPYNRSEVAIRSGLIELVESVFVSRHINEKQHLPADACTWAAEEGNLEVMEYLHNKGCKMNEFTSMTAARHGHTSILQFLVEKGYELDGEDLIAAVEGGHLECVQTICSLIAPDQKETSLACDVAAMHGQLEILKLLYSEGFTGDEYTTAPAAAGGHLQCIQYLHEHGCEWNVYTCTRAARHGHLHCLQYAHQHGCAIDNSVAEAAVEGSHLACLQYAHEHGCVWTYIQHRKTSHVCFELDRRTIQHSRTQYCSPLLWDYLRIHATNAQKKIKVYEVIALVALEIKQLK